LGFLLAAVVIKLSFFPLKNSINKKQFFSDIFAFSKQPSFKVLKEIFKTIEIIIFQARITKNNIDSLLRVCSGANSEQFFLTILVFCLLKENLK